MIRSLFKFEVEVVVKRQLKFWVWKTFIEGKAVAGPSRNQPWIFFLIGFSCQNYYNVPDAECE